MDTQGAFDGADGGPLAARPLEMRHVPDACRLQRDVLIHGFGRCPRLGHEAAQLGFSLRASEAVPRAWGALATDLALELAAVSTPMAVPGLAAIGVGEDVEAARAVGAAPGHYGRARSSRGGEISRSAERTRTRPRRGTGPVEAERPCTEAGGFTASVDPSWRS